MDETVKPNPLGQAVDRLISEGKVLPQHRGRCVAVLEEEMKKSAEAYAKALGRTAVKTAAVNRVDSMKDKPL